MPIYFKFRAILVLVIGLLYHFLMDLILDTWSSGPLNQSDFKFLACTICPSCRRVNVRPLKENNSDEIARFLLEESFQPAPPKYLVSDRGTSVASKYVLELLNACIGGL